MERTTSMTRLVGAEEARDRLRALLATYEPAEPGKDT
jgi:hypothetical protein